MDDLIDQTLQDLADEMHLYNLMVSATQRTLAENPNDPPELTAQRQNDLAYARDLRDATIDRMRALTDDE